MCVSTLSYQYVCRFGGPLAKKLQLCASMYMYLLASFLFAIALLCKGMSQSSRHSWGSAQYALRQRNGCNITDEKLCCNCTISSANF